jgi:hypothetical protein
MQNGQNYMVRVGKKYTLMTNAFESRGSTGNEI